MPSSYHFSPKNKTNKAKKTQEYLTLENKRDEVVQTKTGR